MKKIISMVLAVLMLASLSGCKTLENMEKLANGMLEVIEERMNSEEASDDSAVEDTEEPAEFSLGSWDGNVYRNDFADITFVKPESWTRYTDEQMEQLMDLAIDVTLDGNALQQTIAQMVITYGMFVLADDGNSNVQLMFENLVPTGSVGISAEDYIEIAAAGSVQQYANAGMEASCSEIQEITIGAYEYSVIHISVDYYGVPINQVIASRVVGDYVVNLFFTSTDTDKIDEMIAQFE